MTPLTTSAFDLAEHPAKADPELIAGDEKHFAAIAESLEQSIADLSDRLDVERRAPGGSGQEADRRDGPPPCLRRPGQRVDEQHQPTGDRGRAERVEVPVVEDGPALA